MQKVGKHTFQVSIFDPTLKRELERFVRILEFRDRYENFVRRMTIDDAIVFVLDKEKRIDIESLVEMLTCQPYSAAAIKSKVLELDGCGRVIYRICETMIHYEPLAVCASL